MNEVKDEQSGEWQKWLEEIRTLDIEVAFEVTYDSSMFTEKVTKQGKGNNFTPFCLKSCQTQTLGDLFQ